MRNLALTLLMFPILFGCEEATSAKMTSADLLQALQGQYFRVRIPSDFGRDDTLSAAIRLPGGDIKILGGFTGGDNRVNGKILKVFIFSNPDGSKRISTIHPGGASYYTLDMESSAATYSDPGKVYDPGESLIRYSPDNELGRGELSGDDFELVLSLRRKQNTERTQTSGYATSLC